jgi:serine/threonine protein kinase
LAAVAYRALTGVPPFVGQNSQDTVIKICTERAPDPTEHRADLPRAVDSLFERALARNPEERFASPSEFAGALAELAKQHPDEAGRAGTPATRTQKGRSDPTETLASPAGESLEDSAPKGPTPNDPTWPRAALIGALLVGLVIAYALLVRTERRELPAPAPAPAHGEAPLTAPPPAPRAPREEPPPVTRTATGQAPPDPGLAARTAVPESLPEPHPAPAPVKHPSPPAPRAPKAPTVDPVFGLPVAPTASAKP